MSSCPVLANLPATGHVATQPLWGPPGTRSAVNCMISGFAPNSNILSLVLLKTTDVQGGRTDSQDHRVTTRTTVLTPRLSSPHNTMHQDTGTEASGKEERGLSQVPFQTPKSALRMELGQN